MILFRREMQAAPRRRVTQEGKEACRTNARTRGSGQLWRGFSDGDCKKGVGFKKTEGGGSSIGREVVYFGEGEREQMPAFLLWVDRGREIRRGRKA